VAEKSKGVFSTCGAFRNARASGLGVRASLASRLSHRVCVGAVRRGTTVSSTKGEKVGEQVDPTGQRQKEGGGVWLKLGRGVGLCWVMQ
jgi:hypothetical protein